MRGLLSHDDCIKSSFLASHTNSIYRGEDMQWYIVDSVLWSPVMSEKDNLFYSPSYQNFVRLFTHGKFHINIQLKVPSTAAPFTHTQPLVECFSSFPQIHKPENVDVDFWKPTARKFSTVYHCEWLAAKFLPWPVMAMISIARSLGMGSTE